MKVIIQIPCYNEEEYILETIKDLPRKLDGVDSLEILIISDGSIDSTVLRAKMLNIKNFVELPSHYGLGKAFREGLREAIRLGADVIVNTDADNQYKGINIQRLIKPVLNGEINIVIGDRQIRKVKDCPFYKKVSQSIGNFLVSLLFKIGCHDATSGFRIFNRSAAEILLENLKNDYTYTLESICILAKKGFHIDFQPIEINNHRRESRLIKNKLFYVKNFLSILFYYYFNRGRRAGLNLPYDSRGSSES